MLLYYRSVLRIFLLKIYQQLQELHAHFGMCVSLLFDSRNLQKQHQQL